MLTDHLTLMHVTPNRPTTPRTIERSLLRVLDKALSSPEHVDKLPERMSDLGAYYAMHNRIAEVEPLYARVASELALHAGLDNESTLGYLAAGLADCAAHLAALRCPVPAETLLRRAITLVSQADSSAHPQLMNFHEQYAALMQQLDRAYQTDDTSAKRSRRA